MPELPEVETVRRGLEPVLAGRRLRRIEIRRPDLRRPITPGMAARLEGCRVLAVRRRAKYLLIDVDSGQSIILHLGMSGRIGIWPKAPPPLERHDHMEVETEDGCIIRLRDPRRFGMLALAETAALGSHPLLAGLGPEPLDPAFDAAGLAARLDGRRTSIKAALLDQTVIAGLGNIYVCESLFRAGLSPRRAACSVRGRRAVRLLEAIREVLAEAIAAGGSSLRDHRRTDGEIGDFQLRLAVYDREGAPCPGCTCDPVATGGVRRIVQGGRSTFYCATRQR